MSYGQANAGQGVWTIVNGQELDAFMALEHHYHSFIVQVRALSISRNLYATLA